MKKHYYFSFLFLTLINFYSLLATNYYVDPVNGNDGNNGLSSSNAYKSLHKIDSINLEPGDTVYFMEGTYKRSGQTLLTINESGTKENYITFTNFENETPILEFDSWTGIDIIGGSSYIKIDGLHIKGASTKVNLEDALAQGAGCDAEFSGGAEGLYNGTGILAVGPNLTWSNTATSTVPHHITVTNCKVYDCTSSGIAFQQADYVTITNNEVYNNCWYTIYGTSGINLYQLVNTDGTTDFHNKITNNLMYGNQLLVPQVPFCSYLDGNGLIIDDLRHTQTRNYKNIENAYDAYDAKSLIANNVAVENGGSGLHFYLSSYCYILNNTIANNASQNNGVNGNAELRVGRSTDFVIKNNIIKSEYTVHANGSNSNIDYTNNYQYGPNIATDLTDCEGCISDDEIVFLNTDTNSKTPYITDFTDIYTDAGLVLTEINDDYLGNARPFGASFDIGAYELSDCAAQTWYADIDNDGFGDIESTIEACEQPGGYVENNTDLCINDSLKSEPGECGCGVDEGTCKEEPIDTGDICDSPEYNISTIYSKEGTTVLYNGFVYENKWHTEGQLPTSGGPWVIIGLCNTQASDCSSIESWTSDTVYSSPGNQVIYEQKIYENLYYITNSIPSQSSAWQLVGFCENTNQKSIISSNASDNLYQITVFSFNGNPEAEYTSTNINIEVTNLNLEAGIHIIQTTNIETGNTTVDKILIK